MPDLSAIASSSTAIYGAALVLCGGGLAFWMKYSTKILFAEKNSEEAKKKADSALTKSESLESRVNQQDTVINEIRTRMAKLDQLPEIIASLKFIEEAVRQIVPRSEQEAKWQSVEQRFARLEADVREIKEHPLA